MNYTTWGEIKDAIQEDMDLQEEPDILAEGELMRYVNDAIEVCEAKFVRLGDYFFSVTDPISVVPGTKDYDLPSDIYANKIRKIFLDDQYEVKNLKSLNDIPFLKNEVGPAYRFKIINQSGARPKIRLFPTPTQAQSMEIYYTRSATRLTEDGGDAQEIEVPEANLFIKAYVKRRIYEKEKSPLYQLYNDEVTVFGQLLDDALAAQIDDENNTIEPDLEAVSDHY